ARLVDRLKVLQACVASVAVGFEYEPGDPIAGLERYGERRVGRNMGVGDPGLVAALGRIGDQDEWTLIEPRRRQRGIHDTDRAGAWRVWRSSVRWNLGRARGDIAAYSDDEAKQRRSH